MSDVHGAPGAGEGVAAPAPASTPAETTTITAREAAIALSKSRWERQKNPQPAPVEAPEASVEQAQTELAEEANAAPVEEQATGETQEAEPAQEPPIERPRSWTKDEDTEWQSLPRAMQQKIVAREQERDTGLRRSQNEAAEKLKGLTAKEQQVEQARQQYESALPALLQTLQDQQAGEFAEVKTTADVNKLAAEDPFRFAQWQARQMQIAAVAQENKAAQDRQRDDYQKRWTDFATKEDQKLLEKVPDLADQKKAQKLQDDAIGVLRDLSFTDQELADLYHGKSSISLRDHRVQQLILDSVKLREAQAQLKKATTTAKPLPPVQRPGVAQPKGLADSQNLQNLSKKLSSTGSLKDAAALLVARRAANK